MGVILKMNDFQQEWCKKILDKLMEKNISKPFHYQLSSFLERNQADDLIQQAPNHNLTYISNQLSEGKYKSPYEFGVAVNEVFEDGIFNFRENSMMFNISVMLSEWFNKKIKSYPRAKQELWVDALFHLQDKISKLLREVPKNVKSPKRDLKRNDGHKHDMHKRRKEKESSDLSDA